MVFRMRSSLTPAGFISPSVVLSRKSSAHLRANVQASMANQTHRWNVLIGFGSSESSWPEQNLNLDSACTSIGCADTSKISRQSSKSEFPFGQLRCLLIMPSGLGSGLASSWMIPLPPQQETSQSLLFPSGGPVSARKSHPPPVSQIISGRL
ncbi:hypothetical protein CABS01_08577 [Colletotrichum abscissum]|uniref:Uncharacterized protein n=1 Tax=Colletotrichum tamarilloi TaxID=1209934 RepID=A0ABQ9RNF7_9PEZI|nr:uncharacterized protein CTAM01_02863 [Colletotrichum tamarilloi]XP_060402093.1 uncharacterized protein CABS01_08577 [Colletotrichum abscissum]KAK1507397.1 hypothetical protein CABS01_08577 [Colletotrichum abscissum]KAK1507751.1 hypothetical protein CTAM01_02863 [Colletotrichum tamarilloi]